MLTDYPEIRLAASYAEYTDKDDSNEDVQSVHVEGLVVMKILQHAREYQSEVANMQIEGYCMGLGGNGTLEITHCFPLLPKRGDDEVNASESWYIDTYQENLRKVNVDSLVVGFYLVSFQGSHYATGAIELMDYYQSELRDQSVCLVFDPLRSLNGKLYLKALRLKPQFTRMLRENQDKKSFTQNVINSYGVSSADIFQELPISIHNCHLVDQYLWELGTSKHFLTGVTEENVIATDEALIPYQTMNAQTLLETSDSIIHELQKYQAATRRRPQDDDRTQNSKPSRLETLLHCAQLSKHAQHIRDVSQITFESISLCEVLQQAHNASHN